MAMNYEDRFKLVEDGRFIRRLQTALWVASAAVLTEDVNTPNHTARLAFARPQMRGGAPVDLMRRIAIRVTASRGVSGAEVTDEQIQTAVDALVDELAS